MNMTDKLALGWWAGWSLMTFSAFGMDKVQAGRGRNRIAEFALCLLGAMGGWPGGLVAMLLFRHKTAKPGFWIKYGVAFLVFAAQVWLWWKER